MSINEDEILKLLEEHTTFEPHPSDRKLLVNKWGSIMETRRFMEFAKALVFAAKNSESDQMILTSVLDKFKVKYSSYGSAKKRFIVPKSIGRKKLNDCQLQRHEFVFDGKGKFVIYRVMKVKP